jgi:peptide chain release factor 3
VKYRLQQEYGVEVLLEAVPFRLARWVTQEDGALTDVNTLLRARIGTVVLDVRERPVVLFEGEWGVRTAREFHPELILNETAQGVVVRDG